MVKCYTAVEHRTKRTIKLRASELCRLRCAPVDCGPDSVMVAYYASAEIGCYLALGWPLPVNVIDLYAEFRCQTNGLFLRQERGAKLIHALAHYGLDAMSAAEKAEMQERAQQNRDYSEEEWQALIAYCLEDSLGCDRLLPV